MKNRDLDELQKYADLFKAMAHPKRLNILLTVLHKAPCVSALQQKLELPQSNISQHLSMLRQLKIVRGERKGSKMCYTIDSSFVEKMLTLINEDNNIKEK